MDKKLNVSHFKLFSFVVNYPHRHRICLSVEGISAAIFQMILVWKSKKFEIICWQFGFVVSVFNFCLRWLIENSMHLCFLFLCSVFITHPSGANVWQLFASHSVFSYSIHSSINAITLSRTFLSILSVRDQHIICIGSKAVRRSIQMCFGRRKMKKRQEPLFVFCFALTKDEKHCCFVKLKPDSHFSRSHFNRFICSNRAKVQRWKHRTWANWVLSQLWLIWFFPQRNIRNKTTQYFLSSIEMQTSTG